MYDVFKKGLFGAGNGDVWDTVTRVVIKTSYVLQFFCIFLSCIHKYRNFFRYLGESLLWLLPVYNWITCIVNMSNSFEHAFHRQCIERWLDEQQSCPICRRVIVSNQPESELEQLLLTKRPFKRFPPIL